MPPKNPLPPDSPDQGAFWGVGMEGNGATDPATFRQNATIIEPNNEGVYYPPTETVTPVTFVPVETVRAGLNDALQKKRNRRRGNTGKHSARHTETGNYTDGLKPGAYLPGFGPVKERNWEDAKRHARWLDAQRLAQEASSPTLDVKEGYDPRPVVEALATTYDIERAVSEEGEDSKETTASPAGDDERSLAPQITSEKKLAIIREKAGFVPATHDEKNTAIGLIFSATERGGYWAHSYLMETYDHLVKHYAAQEGVSFHEAKKKATEGVTSRINEMGDYLQGAVDDGKALQWLQEKLDTTLNPTLTLEEAAVDSFDPITPDEAAKTKDEQTMLWAMAAIVRYYDHETHQVLPFLPMTEREDRSVDRDQDGKNKQLYNPYVAAFMLTDERPEIIDKYAVIRKHVTDQIQSLTVKELRILVPRALEDQRSRYRFWRQALKDLKGSYKQIAKRRIDA